MQYRLSRSIAFSILVIALGCVGVIGAQNNTDAELDALLGNTTPASGANRGYIASDANLIRVVSTSQDNKVTIEAPLAKKDNQEISSYFIARGEVPYNDITTNPNADITKIKDSVINSDEISYSVTGATNGTGRVLRILANIDNPAADQYITIIPQDNTTQGNLIQDYRFNVTAMAGNQTQVLADSNNASLNQAITNISCTRAERKDEVTVKWDRNTALNANKVEIYYKTDASQGSMTLKGTPDIADKSFTFETDGRGETLIKLKPLTNNGAPIGNEVMYTCMSNGDPQTHDAGNDDNNDQQTQTTIGTIPHTGPKETFAIVLIGVLLLYFIYKKYWKAKA